MLVYIEPLSMFPQLHSDTIFGAIAFAISELYPEKIIEDMISEFEKTPPFILSSAFPFIKDGEKKIKFFPKIINKHTSIKDEDINKKYRKVKYIQEDIFLKLASGELSEYELLTNISVKEKENNKKFKIYDNNYLIDIDLNITAKLKDMVIPSNSINRITGETEIFYSEGKFFEKNHGLLIF